MTPAQSLFVQSFISKLNEFPTAKTETINIKNQGAEICITPLQKKICLLFTIFSSESDIRFKDELWLTNVTDRIIIWEDQWQNQQDIILSRLQAILGLSKRIYARNTVIAPINNDTYNQFINAHHLMRSARSKTKFGLFHAGRLVAAAGFSKKRNVQRENKQLASYELIRYCNKSGLSVVGGLSKCISHFEDQKAPDDLMTYADKEWSEGQSYERIGFEQTGQKDHIEMWLTPDQFRTYKKRLPALSDKDLYQNGYGKVYSAGNIKFNKRVGQ